MQKTFVLSAEHMSPENFAVLRQALQRRLAERGCALGEDGFAVELCIGTDLREGEYRVHPSDDSVHIVAADDCAAFAGLGAWLRACSFDGEGGCEIAKHEFAFTPERPVRGLYFASHFHNFYHIAPVDKVLEQIEDSALRGGNAIAVWYDMHHFASLEDADSRSLIVRLKQILRHARSIGMKTCMTMLSNEAFSGTPEHLKAQSAAQNGYHSVLDGHYGVEICPNAPGGIEEIVRQRRLVLHEFADVQPDYIMYWPYDQGGCTCEKCAPWGANGLLKLFPHFVGVVREEMPGAKIIFSTWYFDLFRDGEWDSFWPLANAGSVDAAEYLIDFFPRGKLPEVIRQSGLPVGKRMLSFPEISMFGGKPWGGFGANPLPAFLQESNDAGMTLYSGMLCYSEGIFEDINKSIMLAACSGREADSDRAIAEYARFEWCMQELEPAVRLLHMLEKALPREERFEGDTIRYVIQNDEDVPAAAALARDIHAKLPARARENWRWRIVYLRALADEALLRAGGYPSEEADAYLEELERIYEVGEKTLPVVRPPTRAHVAFRCKKI